jgi:hypothetical protein
MTKCIVLGDNQEKPKSKPIEFTYWLEKDSLTPKINFDPLPPPNWDVIELISKGKKLDIMYAYDDDLRTGGVIYLGKWNDGFVEGGDQ